MFRERAGRWEINKLMKEEQIKNNLKEAREKGWWIACFYWEKQLEKLGNEQEDN